MPKLEFRDLPEACRALEATLVRQLIASSGAFKGSDVAGSQVRADMFTEALADAVTKGGGLGIARLLERTLGGEGATEAGPAEGPPPGEPSPLPRTTSGFGMRVHPIDGTERFHTGVDLAGGEGTTILAAAEGVVRRAGPRGGYGNAVEIDHGGGVTTLYAHASELSVTPGEKVEAGQALGGVGQTGRATGPHLHFEVRVEGKAIDPRAALKAYGIRAEDTIGGKPPRGL